MKNNNVDYNHKVLEVDNLKKYFYNGTGKNKLTIPAVDGLSFDVYKREVFGLVGESGCGKTTTGRTIIKLYNPTEGIVKLNGEVICAGTKQHNREIKNINEQARERILSFDKHAQGVDVIEQKLAEDIKFINSEIDFVKRDETEALNIAGKPLEDYKKTLYETKNIFETDIEKINYNYNLDASNVHDSTMNAAELEQKREISGATLNFERKLAGLKESSALEKEVIEKRIETLKTTHENNLAAIKDKYVNLIIENEKNKVDKHVANEQLKALKEKRKNLIAKRKEQYKVEQASIVKPDKAEVLKNVNRIKSDSKTKIAAFNKQIADLKANAKKAIAKIPANVEQGINQEELKAKIAEIKDWQREAVKAQKDIIHDLKATNKSKEALETSRKMQMIFQDPISSLNPRMTVQEIVGEGLTIIGGYTKEEIKETVGQTLEIVGLSREYAARYPHEFSGGQRQRIGVARALIMNPDFIIADEPISALDVSIRAQVINLLTELKESLGLTILFIAHDLSVVRFFCDRIAVMYYGKIVELAASEELFKNPMHPYTQSLLSSIPQPDPDYERNRKRIGYNPRMHDYRKDKPSMREISHLHYIYANEEEFVRIKAEYDERNKNSKAKGDK